MSTSSYVDVSRGNLIAFKAAIRNGPTGVAFAVGDDFFSYQSGLFTGSGDSGCETTINHGMVAVGYGVTSDSEEYVIVRNSWGTGWGESGYVNVLLTEGETNGGVC
jgi:KDEL-tailed cysteine endopeptidase